MKVRTKMTAFSRPSNLGVIGAVAIGGVLLMAHPAMAQGIGALDLDGNGTVSFSELLIAHPEITTEAFLEMDSDGDDVLNAAEVAAARADGMIPAQ